LRKLYVQFIGYSMSGSSIKLKDLVVLNLITLRKGNSICTILIIKRLESKT